MEAPVVHLDIPDSEEQPVPDEIELTEQVRTT